MLKKLIAFIHSGEIASLKESLARSVRSHVFLNQHNEVLRGNNERLAARLSSIREQRDEAIRKEKASRSAAAVYIRERDSPAQVDALRIALGRERSRNKELEQSLSYATAVLKETQDELDSVVKARDIQANTIGRQQARLQELDNLTRRGQDSSEFSIIAVDNPVYFSKSGLSKVKLIGTHWAVYHTRTMERISMFRKSHAEAAAVSYNAIKEYNERNRA